MVETDNQQQTCGKGVAANATLPESMSTLLSAVADVLHNHVRALSPKDAAAREEIAAYQRLVSEHRAIASKLSALADVMRSYRDLPVAEHDIGKLSDTASIDVMAAFVATEEATLMLLRDRVAEHSEMLRQMRGG